MACGSGPSWSDWACVDFRSSRWNAASICRKWVNGWRGVSPPFPARVVSKWLAFASDRGEKRQVYRIDPTGGEAEPLSSDKEGVQSFAWSPDGRTIAYVASDPKHEALEQREKKYGDFAIEDADHRMADVETGPDGVRFTFHTGGNAVPVLVPVPGLPRFHEP